jgi:hypothetical protein
MPPSVVMCRRQTCIGGVYATYEAALEAIRELQGPWTQWGTF